MEHDKVHLLIKCFSSCAITISCLASIPYASEAALHCKSIAFWRDSAVNCLDSICMLPLAAKLLQSAVTLPSWELHRQVHRVWRKKK